MAKINVAPYERLMDIKYIDHFRKYMNVTSVKGNPKCWRHPSLSLNIILCAYTFLDMVADRKGVCKLLSQQLIIANIS